MIKWYLLLLFVCALIGVGAAHLIFQPQLDAQNAAAALRAKPTPAPKMRTFVPDEIVCMEGRQYIYLNPNIMLIRPNPEHIFGISPDYLTCD